MINISINRDLNISIYKQIVSQITEYVENGLLRPGERLPTERELSAKTGVARDTIRRAYRELESKSITETMMGSGTFVSGKQDISSGGRRTSAVRLIDEVLNKLGELGFTPREIRAIIDIRIVESEIKHGIVRIAAIDCNPEALEIFKEQISYMKNIEFRMFILEDIMEFSQPNEVFDDYDIIITTPTHFDQICSLLFQLRKKLFKIAVSPSRDTIIKLVTISENSKIGIIVKSINFRNIILRHLESLNFEGKNVDYVFDNDTQGIINLLEKKDILIIPQCFSIEGVELQKAFQEFLIRGGRIIDFKYQIERGSLIYIEEQICSVLRNR